MIDLNCLLAGLVRLSACPLLLVLLRKKTGALIYPAFAAYGVCILVFIFAYFIRAGFSGSVDLAYFIKRGLLYGVFEETAKFAALKFLYDNFNSRYDAVSYGLGHCSFEEFGAGFSCLALIGTDKAAPDIFLFNLWAAAEGAAFCVALTVMIYYGIVFGRTRVTLPAAILLHTFSNMAANILKYSPAAIPVLTAMTAGICVGVYFLCMKKLRALDGE